MFVRSLTLLIAGFALLIAHSHAAAQLYEHEVSRVPQAISTDELRQYAALLNLSEAQQLAFDHAYDTYLDDLAPLRAETTELLMAHAEAASPTGRSGQDGIVRHLPRLAMEMTAHDDALFARIRPILTETQAPKLQRVHWLRERTMYLDLNIIEAFIGGGAPSLADLLDKLQPTAELRAELQHVLLEYDRQLTDRIRLVFRAAVECCSENDSALAERLVERVRELRAFNRRSYHEILQMLPDHLHQRWHDVFYRYAYPPAWEAMTSMLIPRLRAALHNLELADSERDWIQQLLQDQLKNRNQYMKQIADALDKHAIRAAGSGAAVSSSEVSQLRNTLGRQMDETSVVIWREVQAALGDRLSDLGPVESERDQFRSTTRQRCNVITFTYRIEPLLLQEPQQRPWNHDRFVAHPIDAQEMYDYVLALGIEDDATRQILMEMHRSYREQLETIGRRTAMAMVMISQTPLREKSRAAKWEELEVHRDELRELLARADRELFADIRSVLGENLDDAGLQRVEAMRARSLLKVHIIRMPNEPTPNLAADVDLVQHFVRIAPQELHDERISDLLNAYDQSINALLQQRWNVMRERDATIELRETMQQAQAMNFTQWLLETQDSTRTANHAVATRNQQFMQMLIALLGPEEGVALRESFTREAYPEAYHDPAAMGLTLEQAFELDNLTPLQRDAVLELRADYAGAYDDLREQMIALCAAHVAEMRGSAMVTEPDRVAAVEHYRHQMQELRDAQASLNRIALRGLRSTLTPAPLRTITLPNLQ